jgi:hypothetical protein
MKISELKIRALNTATSLIDTYFGGSGITEKFINSTLKLILKQNIHKLDDMLVLFTDKDGEINANDVINEYANMIGDEGLIFDLKQYVPNEMVRNLIPDKVLIIKKDDILSILR